MIESPASYDSALSDDDLKTIGRLAISWSTTEHVIGNCLKTMLRLTDDEAQIAVFPLGLERRLSHMQALAEIPDAKWEQAVRDDLEELVKVMDALRFVRNNVIHAICVSDENGDTAFHLRSKKSQALSVEELTNYAARLALNFRFALGFKSLVFFGTEPLPERPQIPDFLKSFFPAKKDHQEKA